MKVCCRLCLCLHMWGVVEVQSSANDGGGGLFVPRHLVMGDESIISFIKIVFLNHDPSSVRRTDVFGCAMRAKNRNTVGEGADRSLFASNPMTDRPGCH